MSFISYLLKRYVLDRWAVQRVFPCQVTLRKRRIRPEHDAKVTTRLNQPMSLRLTAQDHEFALAAWLVASGMLYFASLSASLTISLFAVVGATRRLREALLYAFLEPPLATCENEDGWIGP